MNHRQHRGLILLNASLLGVLGLATLAPIAGAGSKAEQNAQPRGRGIYTMVGAKYTGGSSNAIFIVDAQNQEMVALTWSDSKKTLQPLGYRNLAADAQLMSPGNSRK